MFIQLFTKNSSTTCNSYRFLIRYSCRCCWAFCCLTAMQSSLALFGFMVLLANYYCLSLLLSLLSLAVFMVFMVQPVLGRFNSCSSSSKSRYWQLTMSSVAGVLLLLFVVIVFSAFLPVFQSQYQVLKASLDLVLTETYIHTYIFVYKEIHNSMTL